MNATTKFRGHLCALFCVIVWGITFIVSAKLLVVFTPIQTMLLRFILAYLILWVLHPKWYFRWQDEVAFLLMSIFSNTLYFMAENTAITYTQSSNVSILVSTAPVLTAILLALTPSSEKPNRNTMLGILVALVGMVMVVFNGAVVLKLNPIGDLLSMGAALSWAVYSLILQRYSSRFSSYLISRKLMFYGILTTLPLLAIEGAPLPHLLPVHPAHSAAGTALSGGAGQRPVLCLLELSGRYAGGAANHHVHLCRALCDDGQRRPLSERDDHGHGHWRRRPHRAGDSAQLQASQSQSGITEKPPLETTVVLFA